MDSVIILSCLNGVLENIHSSSMIHWFNTLILIPLFTAAHYSSPALYLERYLFMLINSSCKEPILIK